jgi:Putative peptidoglycan binding domain
VSDTTDTGRPPRRTRWRVAVVVLGVVVLGTAAVATVAVTGAGRAGAHRPAAGSGSAGLKTTPIVRTDLSDSREFAGALGYGAEQGLRGRVPGTVTWLPAPGSTVDRGQPLYRVDEKPVTLFFGTIPPYRKLDKAGLKGADVAVVKANLTALGIGAGGGADDEYTAGTVDAVKRWQRAIKQPDTGAVDVGDVIVLPGPVRVATIKTQLAGPADTELMSVTGTSKVVTVPVEASQLDNAKVGDPVSVVPSSGTPTPGKVTAVGDTASAPDAATGGADNRAAAAGDQAKVTVTVTLDGVDAAKALVSGPVRVLFTGITRNGVLAVPLDALLALSEGGYAVEIMNGPKRSLVAVKTGLFAKGLVEVTGSGLAEGQRVVVTS